MCDGYNVMCTDTGWSCLSRTGDYLYWIMFYSIFFLTINQIKYLQLVWICYHHSAVYLAWKHVDFWFFKTQHPAFLTFNFQKIITSVVGRRFPFISGHVSSDTSDARISKTRRKIIIFPIRQVQKRRLLFTKIKNVYLCSCTQCTMY